MGSGYSKMKKQARMMQEQFQHMQEKMKNTIVEGSSGSGLVTISMNGEKEIQNIQIKPECATDLEGLQDLIIAACKDAYSKLQNQDDQLPSFF